MQYVHKRGKLSRKSVFSARKIGIGQGAAFLGAKYAFFCRSLRRKSL
ncbi:MAG: hypothetical protein IJX87_04785 [Clostridia bacterium]|nr:hypothetical protein [Clostridia bacterium]